MEQRKSNMELLRVVGIILIVVFHCAYKSGFSFEPGFSANKLIIKTFWMFGELGVNLFALIFGYFMVNGRFKWKKLIRLLAEVQFYFWMTIIIGSIIGVYTLSGRKKLLLAFFPVTLNRYWFITAYLLVYILSPYLNLLIRAMNGKTYRKFLLTVLLLYCAVPTVFGFFFNDTEVMLYYNRFIWLIIMYFLGAYIRIYMEKLEISVSQLKKRMAWTAGGSFASLVLSILVIDRYSNFFEKLGTAEPAYFWHPNTVPMVLLSIAVFTLFLCIRIPYNRVINTVASATLGIYLLHDGVLASWLWKTVFRCAEYQNSPLLVFRILTVSAIVLAAGLGTDLIRQLLERYTLNQFLDSRVFKRSRLSSLFDGQGEDLKQ